MLGCQTFEFLEGAGGNEGTPLTIKNGQNRKPRIKHLTWFVSYNEIFISQVLEVKKKKCNLKLSRMVFKSKCTVSRREIFLVKAFFRSLTNSRGSRVAGPKSRVAGPKSRSRVQCRGRGSKVAVAGPMSRQGKMIWKRLIWKQYEGKKSFLCTILYGSQFTGYGC